MYSVEQGHLVSAYGDFFSRWAWDHLATLTFGKQLSRSGSIRHWNEFINSLGRLTRGRVGWVRADEERWSGQGMPAIPLHFHALLKYQNPPSPHDVTALWKSQAGDAMVELYEPGRGAAWYIAKMFPYGDAPYDLGGLNFFTPLPASGQSAIDLGLAKVVRPLT